MKINLAKIHSKCGWHEKEILRSKICGCFNCLNMFPPTDITEWIEELKDCPRGSGKTAVCPICDIDTVLPDTIETRLTVELLRAMQNEYCEY